MPRDIDDQIRRRDREREHGEIIGEDRRDRDRHDPDMSGQGTADDVEGSGLRRKREERRSSWDEDDEDLRDRRERDGYR